jgi:hypothetical protein
MDFVIAAKCAMFQKPLSKGTELRTEKLRVAGQKYQVSMLF